MSPELTPEQVRTHDLAMFIIDVLRHDVEAIPNIILLLNDRGSIGWRNFVVREFSTGDVIPVLEGLVADEMVQPLRENPQNGELIEIQEIGDLAKDLNATWFTLTRKALDEWKAWKPPRSLDDRIEDIIRGAHQTLGDVFRLLNQQLDVKIDPAEFARLVDSMIECDCVQL